MAAWLDASLGLAERVAALLADLSVAEREAIALGGFDCLVERGVPAPDYVDAGTGLRGVDGATAFPAGIALASGFDPDLAREYGAAVGAEARAAGFSVLLGPTLDLARDPRGGRIPEAFGEDPYLAGLLGAAHVAGAQSNHVICQLKHFVAYNGEDRRTGCGLGDRGDAVDVRVSMPLLQDVYLRPFRAAIEAGAWSVMGSYNRINGTYACENREVLGILREQWGWQGFSCPDFLFAVRDDAGALAAGLDLPALGGPGGRTPEMLAEAAPGVVERLVGHLATALIGSGLADHPLPDPVMPSTAAHRALAERVAVAGTVLLKNDRAALPLAPATSVAVIGPAGADAFFVGGGAAAVTVDPGRIVTPRAGIEARARTVVVAQGSHGDVPLPGVPAEVLSLPDGSAPGVEVEFVDAGGRSWIEVLPDVDHRADPADPAARWPRRWRALLTPRRTGRHRFSLTLGGRARLRLDGRLLAVGSRELEQFIAGPRYPLQAVVDLEAGTPVALEIEYSEGPAIAIPPMQVGPTLRLGWQEPDDLLAGAVSAAAGCDAAVVLVNQASGEGMDREGLALPGDQDELVRRVAAANPRTIVVLNTPGAVLMPWLDEVAAVLQVWYPGERFGAALAAVLFGDAEPGGRLPLTFPHSREHLPGGDHGPEVVVERLDYDADGGLGHRAPGIAGHGVLFGFGDGLGYAPTSAAVTGARVVDGRVELSLRMLNEGDRDTVHVAQAYAGVAGAAPELVGVTRVPVPAGGAAVATVSIGPDAFSRWDAGAAARRPVRGLHRLFVGTSSRASHDLLTVSVEDGAVVRVEWPGDPARAPFPA